MGKSEKPDLIVNAFTEEFLRSMKARGESKAKKWGEPPTVVATDDKWALSYCIENFIRIAAISRVDTSGFSLDDFYEEIPDFKKVFGEALDVQPMQMSIRGACYLLRFNNFFKDPAFPTVEKEPVHGPG